MVCPDLKESSRRLERLLRSQSLLRCWTGTLLLPSDTKLKTVLPRSDFQGLMIISAVEELLQVGHKNCLIGTCLNSLHLQASSNFSEMARLFLTATVLQSWNEPDTIDVHRQSKQADRQWAATTGQEVAVLSVEDWMRSLHGHSIWWDVPNAVRKGVLCTAKKKNFFLAVHNTPFFWRYTTPP